MARQQSYRTLPITGTQNALVMGMSWQTVLGQDLTVAAMKAARQAGATHFTQAGPRSPAVGLLKAEGRDRRAKAKTRLYSAAAAFAQLHRHGTQIVSAELPSGEVWIAVAVDGTVQTGGDKVLPNADAGRQALETLIERYRDAVIHGAARTGAMPFQLSQLATLANTQSSLRRAAFRLSMISPVWWVVLALLVSYLAWDAFQTWWHEKQAMEQQRLDAMRTSVDAHALWQQALNKWARATRADGESGLLRLLESVAQAPVTPGRWVLAEVFCQPAAQVCSAKYKRSRLADNNTLQAALPADWHVVFPDLETAKVDWKMASQAAGKPLQLADIPDAAAVEDTWAASWQALTPALQDFKLDPIKTVPVRVPNIRLPNGLEQPVELPSGMTVPAMLGFTVNAPLRSLYALALPDTTTLAHLQIRYQPDATAKLNASSFSATLEGVIYVQPR